MMIDCCENRTPEFDKFEFESGLRISRRNLSADLSLALQSTKLSNLKRCWADCRNSLNVDSVMNSLDPEPESTALAYTLRIGLKRVTSLSRILWDLLLKLKFSIWLLYLFFLRILHT